MRSILLLTFVCIFVASAYAQVNIGAVGQAAVNANDIATLQYALTLENIEADFYSKGQAQFNAQAFINAGFSAADFMYFNMIRDHEIAHVNFLAGVISGLGSIPVSACNTTVNSYSYTALGLGDPFGGAGNVAVYVAIAAALEPLGTNAYVTAATFIGNKAYLQAAATIATVEARHAQYVLHLNNRTVPASGDASFPIRDLGLSVTDVAAKVQALSAVCAGYLTVLPVNLLNSTQQAVTLFSLTNQFNASTTLAGSANITANDNAVLQYALYLEYFEAAFYAAAVGVPGGAAGAFNAASFAAAGYGPEVFTYLQLIAAHEQAHVNTLVVALTAASALIQKCTYNFTSVTTGTAAAFINTAAGIEPLGVSAYDGIANALTSRTYLQIAAGIATVEGRHASILALFALNVSASSANVAGPFPNTFDPTNTPADVRTKVLATGLLSEVDGCRPSPFPARVYYQQSAAGAAVTVAPTGPTPTNGPTGGAIATPIPTGTAPTATPSKTTTSSAAVASVSVVVMIVVACLAL